ncbi:F0F1 ATP synthase subunit delta [Paenibacillus turpanensis]|uniref:F0F1 ATP synthase subunit delta n=1 Tax=Paenibacillus turpanensis TaxID=2689078 RepID=UPI00140D5457|nr:F0F1 ATP synthase subunit delta [Paenibacillus turpanensis]
MSGGTLVAKRYAKALLEVAQENGNISVVRDELKAVSDVIANDEQIRSLLEHPSFGKARKHDLIKQVFEGKLVQETYNTLQVLVENGREQLIDQLAKQYALLADQAVGKEEALVYSPIPLSEADQASVAEAFGKITGKALVVDNVVDPSLLGGIKVRIGDRLYDGSLSSKLLGLQKQLTKSQAL